MTVAEHRARTTRRGPVAVVVAALAATIFLAGCLTADQQQDFDLINAARKANRKTALTSHAAATTKAQKWAERMARTGVLEHTGGGSKLDTSGVTGWCTYGENVGKGPSVKAVHDAFMRSSTHKANILGGYTAVGTGIHKSGSTYWVTEVFLRIC